MPSIILLNKPFNTLSQFTDDQGRNTLKALLPNSPGFNVAGRLDYDSEGLLVLTDNGPLQHHICSPKHKQTKTYWVQVEGLINEQALSSLRQGLTLKDGLTRPAQAKRLPDNCEHKLWPRTPPIRERKDKPTSWLELTITEGKNRQVRRMTAATGFPTLRLIRMRIGDWSIEKLQPGEHRTIQVAAVSAPSTNTPKTRKTTTARYRQSNAGRKKRR